jgi:tRNASer (uridine44-2'-O)-methyltransferase
MFDQQQVDPSRFNPQTPTHKLPTSDQLQGQEWQPMLSSTCTFQPETFLSVMHNLIKNPNIMSTHLFRADILYDSDNDHSMIEGPSTAQFSDYTKHLKQDYQPQFIDMPGYAWSRTYVRQLVPRNRQVDHDLAQTCHFYAQQHNSTTNNLILYVPHVNHVDKMPWYHPKVRIVAFHHTFNSTTNTGTVSTHYLLFPTTPLDNRLDRTALQLLTKIHKHGQGEQAGYQKRVQLDKIVPQKRFQETYARLKSVYARTYMQSWVENTDPAKHVFEDLGIAAFLMELWKDMYDCSGEHADETKNDKSPFPGFVDIGCGNGLLVNLLILEGFSGWGFDARQRKSWKMYSILVPDILYPIDSTNRNDNSHHLAQHLANTILSNPPNQLNQRQLSEQQAQQDQTSTFHNGIFPPGTFIISNHADELTPWTPLIAHLNSSPFIAIPCCSHSLNGSRWRAPASAVAKEKAAIERLEQQSAAKTKGTVTAPQKPEMALGHQTKETTQAAETGSLLTNKKKEVTVVGTKNVQSAYASLCDYVCHLAEEAGFEIEKEVLRIPSTRNVCLLGRKRRFMSTEEKILQASGNQVCVEENGKESYIINNATTTTAAAANDDGKTETTRMQERKKAMASLVAKELDDSIQHIHCQFVAAAEKLLAKKNDGH